MEAIKVTVGEVVLVDIDDLQEFQGDLKELTQDNYERMKASIIKYGVSFLKHAWKDKGVLKILDGHQTKRTLTKMREEGHGIPKIPVALVKAKNEKEAKEKLLAAASQYGKVTDEGLYEFMHEAGIDYKTAEVTFNFPEIDMREFQESYFTDPETDAEKESLDDAPEPPKTTDIVRGDMFILGEHRLLCGDSTRELDVKRLMNGELADLVFTDPPYGVNYDGGHANDARREKLVNDHSTEIYKNSVPLMFEYSKPNAALYLWFAATKALQVLQVLQVNRYDIRCWLIWNKNMAQFGAIGAQYKQKHEPCLYAHKKGTPPFWDGPTNEVSVWDENRAMKNEFHPTQKPVGLAKRAMANSCPKGGGVLDLFGGSGSTLIACQDAERKSFTMELEPLYCDVIVQRWEKLTGKKAVKQSASPPVKLRKAKII